MSEQIIMKRCTKCKIEKALFEFYNDRSRRDGLQCWCKECTKRSNKDYRQTPAGIVTDHRACRRYSQTSLGKQVKRKIFAKYLQSDKGKLAKRKGEKKYRQHYPEKILAHHKISNAIQSGKLPKPDTFQCSCSKQAEQYHHPSYLPEQRLNVIAVCIPCHNAIHSRVQT